MASNADVKPFLLRSLNEEKESIIFELAYGIRARPDKRLALIALHNVTGFDWPVLKGISDHLEVEKDNKLRISGTSIILGAITFIALAVIVFGYARLLSVNFSTIPVEVRDSVFLAVAAIEVLLLIPLFFFVYVGVPIVQAWLQVKPALPLAEKELVKILSEASRKLSTEITLPSDKYIGAFEGEVWDYVMENIHGNREPDQDKD